MVNDFTIGDDLDRTWKSHQKTMPAQAPHHESRVSCFSSRHETLQVSRARAQQAKTLEFSVQVLTQGFWPTQKSRELQSPHQRPSSLHKF